MMAHSDNEMLGNCKELRKIVYVMISKGNFHDKLLIKVQNDLVCQHLYKKEEVYTCTNIYICVFVHVKYIFKYKNVLTEEAYQGKNWRAGRYE